MQLSPSARAPRPTAPRPITPRSTASRSARPALALARAAGCAAFLAPCLAHGEALPGLSVRLSPGESPGELLFELANEGERTVSVLLAGTALDAALAEDAFDVRRTLKGWPAVERAAYAGRLYKREAPAPDDFVRIAPGQTLSSTVAIDRLYEVANAGHYTVRFDGAFAVSPGTAFDDGSGEIPGATRPDASTTVVPGSVPGAGTVELELRPGTVAPRARPPAFNGCSAEQQSDILVAVDAAESIAAESLDSLRSLPEARRPTAPRYLRWFGTHTPARYATVADGFDAIHAALSGQTLGLDCTCDESGVFAYVYANAPYDVFLCPTFFAADTLGTDSRAGTLVHELSHFRAVLGTEDYSYGQSAVAALAQSDPERAVDNADSFEYFAENTPALEMSASTPAPESEPGSEPEPQGSPFEPLAPGAPARGSLARGELAGYRVEPADAISLTSLAGDADLFVFDNPELEGEPTCAALAFSADSALDVCELPFAGTWYAVVAAYESADYELQASEPETGSAEPDPGAESPAPAIDPDGDPGGDPGGDPDAGSGGGSAGASLLALAGLAAARRRRRTRARA